MSVSDDRAKEAKQKICKLLRTKVNSYGSPQSPPVAPRNSSMHAESLRGVSPSSTTLPLSPGAAASAHDGVSGCWLCGCLEPPFVDNRLNLLYSLSVNFPALPATDTLDGRAVTPSKGAKINRNERKAKKNGFDLVEDVAEVRTESTDSPLQEPTYQPGPAIDLASMTLCMNCFRLCYNAFSRPALLADKAAGATRDGLSKRIRRLAYSLSVPKSGIFDPFEETTKVEVTPPSLSPPSVPTAVVSPKQLADDLFLNTSFADKTSAEVILPLGASINNRSLSMSLGASHTNRRNTSSTVGATPHIAEFGTLMNTVNGERSIIDDTLSSPHIERATSDGFVQVTMMPYVNTIGNFLLTEEVIDHESHEGLVTPDRRLAAPNVANSGGRSPVIFGARGSFAAVAAASHNASLANAPPTPKAFVSATSNIPPPEINVTSPPTSPPRSGGATAPPSAPTSGVATGKVISKGQTSKKPTDCNFCGDSIHPGRPQTSCVAFHPNDYLHHVWECASCTSIMTVQLPQCLVCRKDAPRFDRIVTGSVVPGQAIAQNIASREELTDDNPTRCIDELLLNIGAKRQPQQGDGNCLFRSLSHQLFGTECHALVRQLCCDYIESHRDDYEQLVVATSLGATTGSSQPTSFSNRVRGTSEEQYNYPPKSPAIAMSESERTFRQYVSQMRKAGTWGDELCVHAAARLFNVRIHVLTSDYPKSRWHLVFQPEPMNEGRHEETDNANVVSNPLVVPAAGSDFDDCSLPPSSNVPATRTPLTIDPNAPSTSDAPPGTNNQHPQDSHNKRADVADIFLLYLRPVHYDDIATPPVMASTMAMLVDSLQKELCFEDGYYEVLFASERSPTKQQPRQRAW